MTAVLRDLLPLVLGERVSGVGLSIATLSFSDEGRGGVGGGKVDMSLVLAVKVVEQDPSR